MEKNTSSDVSNSSKNNFKKVTLIVAVMLTLVIAGYGGIYYWQNQKIIKANNELSSMKINNETLKKKIVILQNQYNQVKGQMDKYQALLKTSPETTITTQADLKLTVDGAQYVNPDGTVTQNGKWFGVNVALMNNTGATISLNNSDFQLKDNQNNIYPELTIQGASTLPDGWVSLPNKTLAPGETIKGTVTFQMPNTNIKTFNFTNLTKAYTVLSSN